MRFVVVMEPDHEVGGHDVSIPALPGCFTQGGSVEESLEHATNAVSAFLDGESHASLRAVDVDPHVTVDVVDVDTAVIA